MHAPVAASQIRMVVSKDAVATSCGIPGLADPGPARAAQASEKNALLTYTI